MSDIDRIQDLQDTLTQDEQNFQARRELAVLLLDNGYTKEALQHLLYLKEYFSDDSGIYYNLGIVYEKIKQYNKATDAYQTAIKLAPNEADAYFNLGLVYIEQKKYDEGIECFQHVLEIDENDSNSYFSLGICYAVGTRGILPGSFGVIKDLNMAKEYLERAITVAAKVGFFEDDNDTMAKAHFALAKVLYAQNVRDDLDKSPLDIANCIPGVNLVSWPITGITRLGEKPALKKFLTTEDGRSMMLHCKTAAELGYKDAAKMLKKLRKAF